MPRYLRPPSSLTAEVESAIEAFGTVFARSVLRHLAQQGPSTTAQIAKALNTDANTVRRRLLQLEDAGLVHASEQRGHRSGRRVTYDLDQARVRDLLTTLGNYLLGR